MDPTPGPGTYEDHTKTEMKNNSNPKWSWKGQTERGEPAADPEGGPGTYDEHRNFDDNCRTHEFGQRRELPVDTTPGPGSYEEQARTEMKNNTNPKWNWKGQTERGEPAVDPEGGPGTYEEHRHFDDNARVHEFGQRREGKVDSNPGPGSYEHHLGTEMRNNSNPKWNWQGQSERIDPKQDPEGGPGTYEEHRHFDDNARVHEFGQRRELPTDSNPGPGSYEHYLGTEMRNNSNPKWNWRGQTERGEPAVDPEGGPGTYDEHRHFDDNARVHEFGQRRESKVDSNPGPGSYEHHLGTEMKNNTNPKWNWQGQTGRKQPVDEPEGGPGTYDEHRHFDDNAKVHEFG